MLLSESMPVTEDTPVDFTESISTLYEPLANPAVDESSILDPLPTSVENAVTFQIIKYSMTEGRPKLINSRGYCFNIKHSRANAIDWQYTFRPKVTIFTLS